MVVKTKFVILFTLCLMLPASLGRTVQDITETEKSVVEADYAYPNPKLTKAQQERLQAGEIVLFDNSEKLLGGIGVILIQKPVPHIWKVITDYPEFQNFMPRCKESVVQKTKGSTVILSTRYQSTWPVSDIRNESLITHHIENPKRLTMMWNAYKSNLKANFGSWVLTPYQGNSQQTLVTYETNFDIEWIPHTLAKSSAIKTLKQTLLAVREQAKNPRYQTVKSDYLFVWDQKHPEGFTKAEPTQ